VLFWWVPVVNVFLLFKVGRLIRNEYEFETAKNELNETRMENGICQTKYPLLLVHGVFFRDFRYLNYWGGFRKN
jgi:triacylglycerol lipase